MVYNAYFTELSLQICDYAQKRRICRENCKYALDENCMAIFDPDERLPSSATLDEYQTHLIKSSFSYPFIRHGDPMRLDIAGMPCVGLVSV